MRKITLAAGAALGLFALPLLALAQDAAPAAPDAGAAPAAPAGDDAGAAPAPKKAHHAARKHMAKKHMAKKHHSAKAKPDTEAPAAGGGDAAPAGAPQQ